MNFSKHQKQHCRQWVMNLDRLLFRPVAKTHTLALAYTEVCVCVCFTTSELLIQVLKHNFDDLDN